ncbi:MULTISPECIES: type II toxin-antitoxin system PrlF family antitoxin [Methylobacterium]|uniref:Antitoxin PrlF n=1 Tax=Methylobacterium thuringiense TaxID=1003091 RepID=A0ABQ4TRQ9_9HYPH|nr:MULTISPECIES: type II toxin-antitoxin system PrlF family antitoxin [Methylobacterium]TXN21220.1 AbrB family transcriptional regulator [Methylobacterium sp. WL9]GJE56573.1 Antitoxin PrlF [Methylobacterium thuringiense]
MATRLRERSRITAKGQTTVPKAVRQALGVSYGGEIAYVVDEHGVSLSRVETDAQDPVIEAFLAFLAEDMTRNPQAITQIPARLLERVVALTAGVAVDLDEELDGPVAL